VAKNFSRDIIKQRFDGRSAGSVYKTLRKWYPNLAAALVGVLVTAVIGLVATSQAATIVVALVLLTALTIGIHYDLPVKVYRAIRFIDEHDTRTFNLSFWGILGIMLVFTIAMGIYGELKARYQWRALAGDIEAYYSNIQTQQGKLEGEAVGATGPRAFELHKQADVLDYPESKE
jgi:hypothetical protein